MTKCYTFYSYKGGSGRSTTCLNTVRHLIDELGADSQRPILVVDADLESAGLTYFFSCEKKFTNSVPYPLHTTYLFSAASSALSSDNGDTLFGIEDPDARSSVLDYKSVYEEFVKHYGDDCSIEEAFNGLDLLDCEVRNLKKILDYSSNESVLKTRKNIFKKFSFLPTLNRLLAVERDTSLTANEKADEKRKIMRAVLPAVSFVDISEHFGVESGTVKFLGADVHYEDAQLLKSDSAVEVIDELRALCDEHGYAAIVFDSGAGVQSSADALQRASNVLVYCMRPTKQFRSGTRTQILNYSDTLEESLAINKQNGDLTDDAKIVIILPTAVPLSAKQSRWTDEAFENINTTVGLFSNIIDGTFCTKETCLNEVELFKWEEHILLEKSGVEDEDRAFDVYKSLAQRLVEFTGKD